MGSIQGRLHIDSGQMFMNTVAIPLGFEETSWASEEHIECNG